MLGRLRERSIFTSFCKDQLLLKKRKKTTPTPQKTSNNWLWQHSGGIWLWNPKRELIHQKCNIQSIILLIWKQIPCKSKKWYHSWETSVSCLNRQLKSKPKATSSANINTVPLKLIEQGLSNTSQSRCNPFQQGRGRTAFLMKERREQYCSACLGQCLAFAVASGLSVQVLLRNKGMDNAQH